MPCSNLPDSMLNSAPPQLLWLGLGCRSGISQIDLEAGIRQVCQVYGLAEAAIAGVATLDAKLNETGLVNLCDQRGWPLRGFSAEQLAQVPVPTPSPQVAAQIGVTSVAEAAALLAAGSAGQLLVPKQIIYSANAAMGAVTIAVACTTAAQLPAQPGTR